MSHWPDVRTLKVVAVIRGVERRRGHETGQTGAIAAHIKKTSYLNSPLLKQDMRNVHADYWGSQYMKTRPPRHLLELIDSYGQSMSAPPIVN